MTVVIPQTRATAVPRLLPDEAWAHRLQALAYVLQLAVRFFFEDAPEIAGPAGTGAAAPSPAYVLEFLASSKGPKLVRVFTQIGEPKLTRSIVRLVEEIGVALSN